MKQPKDYSTPWYFAGLGMGSLLAPYIEVDLVTWGAAWTGIACVLAAITILRHPRGL